MSFPFDISGGAGGLSANSSQRASLDSPFSHTSTNAGITIGAAKLNNALMFEDLAGRAGSQLITLGLIGAALFAVVLIARK